jgi:hypothetical protein
VREFLSKYGSMPRQLLVGPTGRRSPPPWVSAVPQETPRGGGNAPTLSSPPWGFIWRTPNSAGRSQGLWNCPAWRAQFGTSPAKQGCGWPRAAHVESPVQGAHPTAGAGLATRWPHAALLRIASEGCETTRPMPENGVGPRTGRPWICELGGCCCRCACSHSRTLSSVGLNDGRRGVSGARRVGGKAIAPGAARACLRPAS